MGKFLKALILAWIGKKIYDRVTHNEEPEKDVVEAPKRAKRKATPRAA